MKAIRRIWSILSQPGSGGLIQPGDWRVLYDDGYKSSFMSFGDAKNMKNIYGGRLQWRYDKKRD